MDNSQSSQPSYLRLLLDESDSDEQWDCALMSADFHQCGQAVDSAIAKQNCESLWDNDLSDSQLFDSSAKHGEMGYLLTTDRRLF